MGRVAGSGGAACCVLGIAFVATLAATLLLRPQPASAHIPITTSIVFRREVAQILQRRCFHCHTAGNLAMPLTTYRDARPWARAIREEILERRMPPWRAVGGHGRFANDISLTSREIDLLVAWIDGGAPSGMPKADEGTPPVTVPASSAWEHGEPDIVRSLEEGRTIQPGTEHEIARFVVPTELARASWLRGIAFRPGDRRVVRGAVFYTAATRQWLGAWTPWHGTTRLSNAVAYRLAAGTRLLVEVHYKGCDEAATDRSAVGLYLTDERPAQTAANLVSGTNAVKIPRGATRHRVRAQAVLAARSIAFAVWPELGPGGRSIEMTALKPDGVVLPLLWVNDYRSEWPTPYIFRDPVALPRGTTILTTVYFDNAGDGPLVTRFRVTLKTTRQGAGR